MGWVKANDYIFNTDEVIVVGPLETMPPERVPPDNSPADTRAKVVLRAGFDFYLKGGPAERFREMFLAGLSGVIQDHDAIEVNETRVFRSDEDPVARPTQADG